MSYKFGLHFIKITVIFFHLCQNILSFGTFVLFMDTEEMGVKVPVWQWRDDWGDWRLYSLEQSDCLEKAFQRKKDGTCVIQRNNNR